MKYSIIKKPTLIARVNLGMIICRAIKKENTEPPTLR